MSNGQLKGPKGPATTEVAFDPNFFDGVSVSGGVTRTKGVWTTVILCGVGSGSESAFSVFTRLSAKQKKPFYRQFNLPGWCATGIVKACCRPGQLRSDFLHHQEPSGCVRSQ